ncbi:hypothetical protein EV421DRAFT_1907097 [Armillaria borealis]|uniref:Uncharacterized protein n=1 Tax=Armillaria borealis TaxID=47425 RepID=A0AA39MKQ5_9AGAR|nr:hypothetical protein EV421DRAFT_1907097 [Armillaria borealis]
MSEQQEGMVAAPADTSAGVVTTSSESESSPATTTTSPASSPSPPLAQGEPVLSDSEDSDTKVITGTDTATVSSASTMITPQEAAAIASVLTLSEDSTCIPRVKFTEQPPNPFSTTNVIRSKRWYAVYKGHFVGVFPDAFIANHATLTVSGGSQKMLTSQEEAMAAFNRAWHSRDLEII